MAQFLLLFIIFVTSTSSTLLGRGGPDSGVQKVSVVKFVFPVRQIRIDYSIKYKAQYLTKFLTNQVANMNPLSLSLSLSRKMNSCASDVIINLISKESFHLTC